MDRQNGFFQRGFAGFSDENADTATPRDRIERNLRDRIFAEEDGIFRRDTESVPAKASASDMDGRARRHLLRQIGSYSIAMAQAGAYLDTHPTDVSLLRYYDTYRTLLNDSIRAYENTDNAQ